MATMTKEDFVSWFRVKFTLAIEVQQITREFQDLRQTVETVAQIMTKFQESALLVPSYVPDEEIKKTIYHDMLRDNIQEFVSISSCKKFEEVIPRAPKWEIVWSLLRSGSQFMFSQWRAPRRSPRCLTRNLEANMTEANATSARKHMMGHVELVVRDAIGAERWFK